MANKSTTDETDKFLKKHNLPKPAQDETENLKSPISIKEIEFIIKKSPT